MIEDLKVIKKKYGEEMMHLCRKLFPTILENKGELLNILLEKFYPNHSLAEDIIKNNLIEEFKDFIYSLTNKENLQYEQTNKSAKQLLLEAGYLLYECHTEDEVNYFKKYYALGEELCTFKGNRLTSCYVFFAVKKDIDNIKREDFSHPDRQDLYGTSILSIQFSKTPSHTLSIKNRYNHVVAAPDSTFSNNLDNIIPGLTAAFEKDYGMKQKHINGSFTIPGYVQASDNKFYKYNYEIDNIYYCPDNIVIDNYEVKKFAKEKYVLFDYFLLDLQNKKLGTYDIREEDPFKDSINDITKIELVNMYTSKSIRITTKDGMIIILLNKNNQITGLSNASLTKLDNYFLHKAQALSILDLPNVRAVGNSCLEENRNLCSLNLPEVVSIKDNFLYYNQVLRKLRLPKVQEIGDGFLAGNQALQKINIPKVKVIGREFLETNRALISLELEEVEEIKDRCLENNVLLTNIYLPNLRFLGNNCSIKLASYKPDMTNNFILSRKKI